MKDPQDLWQNQPTEEFKMSIYGIRRRAEQLQTQGRLGALMWMTMGPAISVYFLWAFIRMRGTLGFAVLAVWGIYVAYHAYRWIWPRTLSPDASVSSTLEFYRVELERRRDYGAHVWRRSGLAFGFLGLAMIAAPWIGSVGMSTQLLKPAPFLILLGVWAVAFSYMRKRKGRKLQEEIDELAAFERSSSGGGSS